MRRSLFLILICTALLFFSFQNFTVPDRVLPVEKKFESSETDPKRRLRDFVTYEIGNEVAQKIEALKSKLKLELGSREPASAQSDNSGVVAPNSAQKDSSDPLKYSLANLRTFRVHDQISELNCRIEQKGVNLVFERKLSSTSSAVLEHNTEQQRSQAKIQFSW